MSLLLYREKVRRAFCGRMAHSGVRSVYVMDVKAMCINGGRIRTAEMHSRGYGNKFQGLAYVLPLNYTVSFDPSFHELGIK